MRRVFWSVLGVGLACSAYCLPLLAPLLAAAGLSGVLASTLFGLSLDIVICRVGPWLLVLAAVLVLTRAVRRRAKPVCGCESVCEVGGCRPGSVE